MVWTRAKFGQSKTMLSSETRRPDQQISGMAGEFLTAGKLFKLGFQVSITLGNAKGIDLFVHNSRIDHTFQVQVKTLRRRNCFPIKKENLKPDHIYVFVILNEKDEEEDFFLVPGKKILNDLNHFFGTSYTKNIPSTFPAINYGPLKEYRNN
jgi:hypothetical protein